MKPLIYINGKLQPPENAKFSVFDASYLYGEGLFETLLAHEGRVLFLDRHLKRLYGSARLLNIPLPFSKKKMREEVYRTLEANGLKNAYIRIGLSAEEETMGVRIRKSSEANLVIFVKPPEPYPESLYKKGGKLIVIRSVQNDPLPLANWKTTNYLSKVVARREIQKKKVAEGVLLNQHGRVTECGGSNLFIVKKGIVITPPLSEGLLPGITREVLLAICKKRKIPRQEKPLTLKELSQADEIFVTSTLKGVLPISDFEGKKFKAPGELTAQLGFFYESMR